MPASRSACSDRTYAAKLSKEDGRLDWAQDAAALDRRVRALNPWPGTFFPNAGESIRVLRSDLRRQALQGGWSPGLGAGCRGAGPPGARAESLAGHLLPQCRRVDPRAQIGPTPPSSPRRMVAWTGRRMPRRWTAGCAR